MQTRRVGICLPFACVCPGFILCSASHPLAVSCTLLCTWLVPPRMRDALPGSLASLFGLLICTCRLLDNAMRKPHAGGQTAQHARVSQFCRLGQQHATAARLPSWLGLPQPPQLPWPVPPLAAQTSALLVRRHPANGERRGDGQAPSQAPSRCHAARGSPRRPGHPLKLRPIRAPSPSAHGPPGAVFHLF